MKNKNRFFGGSSPAENRQNGVGRGAEPYMTFYSQEDYEREIENEIARRIGQDGNAPAGNDGGYTEDFSLFGRTEAITPSPSMTFGGTYFADGSYGAHPSGGYGMYPQSGYGVNYANGGRGGYGTYPQNAPQIGYGADFANGGRGGYGTYPQNAPQSGYGVNYANGGRGGYGTYPQNAPQSGYGVNFANGGRGGYGTYPQNAPQNGYVGNYPNEMTSDEIIDTWREDADKLSKIVPDFDLASALGNETFKNALVSGENVFEAYSAMMTPPKNPPRAGIRQNGQSARRGTGEAKVNPAKLSRADFKKYIDEIKNGSPC